jgi:SAM-dependent methyltransferase
MTNPAMRAYDIVAGDYDLVIDDGYADQLYGTYNWLIKRYEPPSSALLDVGCGTGRSSFYFADRGFCVTAFDISESMIAAARSKPNPHGVTFSVSDMLQFRERSSFGAALGIWEPLNYLSSEDALVEALIGISGSLVGGGLFIFDMNTYGSYRSAFQATEVIELPDTLLVWRPRSGAPVIDGEVVTSLDVFRRVEDTLWCRKTSVHRLRHFSEATVRHCLQASGMQLVDVFGLAGNGGLADVPNEEDCRRLVYVARAGTRSR